MKRIRPGATLLALALPLCACSLLPARPPVATAQYALDRGLHRPARNADGLAPAVPRPSVLVELPGAAAGFDSNRMIYLQEPHRLRYFAHSEWVDAPARMLAPLLVGALQAGGRFKAVIEAPSDASADLRLDTQILELQQEFQTRPSRVRFGLRVILIEVASRRVLATQDFERLEVAASDDPAGGAEAAQRAVDSVALQLVAYCAKFLNESMASEHRATLPVLPEP